ncbi:MAG: DUF4296 domain-containing protein [Bacteroidales bacterium]|nr:DUF4296 domain-containing protein [Bacteroidales bacterium]
MRKLLYFVLALLTLSVVASCIDRPDIVLDEDQMIDLLVDVHRAEGLFEMQQQQGVGFGADLDTYQKEVIAAVLQKHGVSRSRYDTSLMWYAQHLKLLTRVYGHVDERLKEEHEMWSLQVTETRDFVTSLAGDSVELWTLRGHLMLDRRRYSDIQFWEIPSDSNFVDGDTLRWSFHVRQLLPGQKVLASISLTKYELSEEELQRQGKRKQNEPLGAPVGFDAKTITENGAYLLTAHADSIQPFRSAILGLVLMTDSGRVSPVFVDSISLLRTHVKNE